MQGKLKKKEVILKMLLKKHHSTDSTLLFTFSLIFFLYENEDISVKTWRMLFDFLSLGFFIPTGPFISTLLNPDWSSPATGGMQSILVVCPAAAALAVQSPRGVTQRAAAPVAPALRAHAAISAARVMRGGKPGGLWSVFQ